MLRQVLLSIDFSHESGIVHGDLQPGNIFFSIFTKDLCSVGEMELRPEIENVQPVKRRDGKKDPSAPKYLTLSQPLTEFVDLGPESTVKISDMGGGLPTLCTPSVIQSSLHS